ncbi:MAG TPA: hypothetical protein VFF76_02470 [Holophagaceae bacterium]|jgi:hypothetical protein|nr:hypothetical protein [Holophagaceae bacterium]
MSISATEPIHRAISWTEKVLFKPFDAGKWFVLGFCAFLAQLGQGGYNYRSGNAFRQTDTETRNAFADIGTWISSHRALTATLGAGILVVVLGLIVLFMWLSSRGQFMFLDGVARNRAEVREPWHRFRDLGNRLFRFQLALLSIMLAILLVFIGAFALAAIRAAHHGFDAIAIATFITLGAVFIVILLTGMVVDLLLRDFAVPVMYLRRTGAWDALGIVWREILPGNGWAFVRFYLMKLVLGLGSAVVILIGCCLTCCLAALPYLSSVVFLPIHVFFRSYSLLFLEQVGEGWKVIGRVEAV